MKVLEREAGEVSHGGYSFAPMAELFKSNEIAVVFLLDVKQTVLVKVLPEPGFSSVRYISDIREALKLCRKACRSLAFLFRLGIRYYVAYIFFLLRSYPVTTDPGQKLMV